MTQEDKVVLVKKVLDFILEKKNANDVIVESCGKSSGETIVNAFSYDERDNFLGMYKFVNEKTRESIANIIANNI